MSSLPPSQNAFLKSFSLLLLLLALPLAGQQSPDQQPTLQGSPLSAGFARSGVERPSADQGSSQGTYKVTSRVVNVPATVRNKHGQIMRDLNQQDFTLTEDGRPQQIRYFTKETDLPLTLGLLVDTSLSQRRVLDQERTASYKFLDYMLRQQDKTFLIHFDRYAELLQDLTADRQKIQSSLDGLHMPDREERASNDPNDPRDPGNGGGYPRGGGGSPFPGGGGSPFPGGGGGWPGGHRRGGGYPGGGGRNRTPGTVLYDAAFLASDELMKPIQGRKALIILTDGVDTGSKVSLDRAIEAAQRADTIVYGILYSDASAYGGFGGFGGNPADGKRVLERIATETGGRMFEVSSKLPIENVYAQIADELRNQYSLGYTPDQPGEVGSYHKIQVKTNQKDLIVQARAGYYRDK